MLSASQRHLDSGAHRRGAGQLDEAAARVPPRQRVRSAEPADRRQGHRARAPDSAIRSRPPRPADNLAQLRAEAARQAAPPPLFNLTTVLPGIRFNNASLRDILNSIGMSTGINVTFDNTFQDRHVLGPARQRHARGSAERRSWRPTSCSTRWSARAASSSFPTTSRSAGSTRSRSIRTFSISHADATELAQLDQHRHPRRRRPGAADGGRQQDRQHHDRPRHHERDGDHRADRRVERQSARRGDGRRADPRGQPVADQAVRPRPRATTRSATVFSPEADPRGTSVTGGGGTASTGTTLAPRPFNANTVSRGINTSDFYLAVPSAVVRFLETDSEIEARRQAAAARRRGSEADAQPRRGSAGALDHLHAGGAGRRDLQPADLVHLPAGRRQRRDHAARHLRRRHHPGAADREQHARRGPERRRPEPAVVHLAQGA